MTIETARRPGEGIPFPTYTVIGVDGGGTTGICKLILSEPEYYEKSRVQDSVVTGWRFTRVQSVLSESPNDAATVADLIRSMNPDAVAVEDFVQLRAAARLKGYRTGARRAADLAAMLSTGTPWRAFRNSASRVKRWATNRRLAAVGIHPRLPHATDAARHALFVAVSEGWLEDPLAVQQRRATARRTPRVFPSAQATHAAQAALYADVVGNGHVEMFVPAPTPSTDPAVGTTVHEALERSAAYSAQEMAGLVLEHRRTADHRGQFSGTLPTDELGPMIDGGEYR